MPLKKPLNLDASVPKIDALVLMDSEGKRIAVDYFTANLMSNVPLQSELEINLYNKTLRTPTARSEAEIIMLDEHQAVYRFIGDLQFYVLGSLDENEVLLLDVLTGFCDSITLLLRNQVEKKCVLENLDLVLLSMDEITESGLILETDPAVIATRVTMRSGDEMGGMDGGYSGSPMGLDGVNPGLQNLAVAFGNVREQLGRALLK